LGLSLGLVLGIADRFRDLIGLTVEILDLGLYIVTLGFQFNEPGDIDIDAPVDAILLDLFSVFDDEFAI